MLLFSALKRQANIQIEEAKRSEFLRRDTNILKIGFTDNKIIAVLENSEKLNKIAKDRKINWEGDVEHDLTKKLFKELYQSESYNEILNNDSNSFLDDKSTRHRIVIAEGATSWRIVQALNEISYLSGEIKEIPQEGSLAPDSYEFGQKDSRSTILKQMSVAM